jgi:hypothetical protein
MAVALLERERLFVHLLGRRRINKLRAVNILALLDPLIRSSSRTRFTSEHLRIALKASQTYAHYFGFVVKRETTIGFVAIPELLDLPFAVLIHTLLSGNDFAADPG